MKWSCGFQLRVRSGPNRGLTHVVDAPVLKVGRAIRPGERVPGWIRVNDDTVSRLHCELFWQDDRKCFRLLHRSSTNSTYVNGEAVEDTEVFDGDIIEIGATTLEVQKADLRWSKATDPSIQEWAPQPKPPTPQALVPEEDTREIVKMQRIPGATVEEVHTPSNRRLGIGPSMDHTLEADGGQVFPLKGSRVRFGSDVPPPDPEPPETEEGVEPPPPPPKPHFDTEYPFPNQNFSYYNLVFMYDEIVQRFKMARVGPNSRVVRIFRKQSGLVWQTELPEGSDVVLMEDDHIQVGDHLLAYRIKEKTT